MASHTRVKIIESQSPSDFEKSVNEFYTYEYVGTSKSQIYTYLDSKGQIVYGTIIEFEDKTELLEFLKTL